MVRGGVPKATDRTLREPQIVKWIMARTPYRLVRNYGINRFQATDQSLWDMRKRGFHPMIVIDGGAHLGPFSLAAERIFPDAAFHLIEPHPVPSSF